ncbi:MAG: hypothetical protein JNJ39_12705 [Blastocatellia bacterium]|nr:hypothetical protein [Blastocatellia bacterium]
MVPNPIEMGKEKSTRKMIADVVEGKDGDKDMGMYFRTACVSGRQVRQRNKGFASRRSLFSY